MPAPVEHQICPAVCVLMKLSFDEEHRHAMNELGKTKMFLNAVEETSIFHHHWSIMPHVSITTCFLLVGNDYTLVSGGKKKKVFNDRHCYLV